ncbi:MAG: carbonic anhydrase [Akkermansiaceae bacterium]|nr:carbonic anhydrase [Armatimonadota bacterium]
MDDLKEFLQGAAKFNDTESLPVKPLLERLAREGQAPEALFLTCADSRVDPLLIMQAQPGDLFILRNIGNLVPKINSKDSSVMATVEYSVGALGVKTIAICGHSDCGAMKAVLSKKDLTEMPHAKEWLAAAEQSTANYENGYDQVQFESDLPEHDKLSKVNVVTQFENLLTYPAVREGIEKNTLRLIGMWFDIGNATVEVYDPTRKTFIPIDQEEVEDHKKHPLTVTASVLGSAVACAAWDGHFDAALTAVTMIGL